MIASLAEPDFRFLARLLRETQAEMRTIRSENAGLHRAIANAVATVETRLDTRLDQTERSIEERLTRIEARLADAP